MIRFICKQLGYTLLTRKEHDKLLIDLQLSSERMERIQTYMHLGRYVSAYMEMIPIPALLSDAIKIIKINGH